MGVLVQEEEEEEKNSATPYEEEEEQCQCAQTSVIAVERQKRHIRQTQITNIFNSNGECSSRICRPHRVTSPPRGNLNGRQEIRIVVPQAATTAFLVAGLAQRVRFV